eukprot:717852_1
MAASHIIMISCILVTMHSQSCSPNPCQNGGSCLSLSICPDDYECECPDDYIGQNCETMNDPCNPNPCLNGGTCTVLDGTAVCDCTSINVQPFCQHPCSILPCLNGGTCVPGHPCVCSECHTGHTCGILVECCNEFVTCFEGCINGECKKGVCLCDAGFTGTCCDTPIDPCVPNPCLTGETCVECPDSKHVCLPQSDAPTTNPTTTPTNNPTTNPTTTPTNNPTTYPTTTPTTPTRNPTTNPTTQLPHQLPPQLITQLE